MTPNIHNYKRQNKYLTGAFDFTTTTSANYTSSVADTYYITDTTTNNGTTINIDTTGATSITIDDKLFNQAVWQLAKHAKNATSGMTAFNQAAKNLGQSVRPRAGFNKYVNASDLLEDFIKYLGEQGVRQGEAMSIPIELFIKWLVIKACEEDQEEPNVTLELPPSTKQPRCQGCQRFMRRGTRVPLHGETCARRYFARTNGLLTPVGA